VVFFGKESALKPFEGRQLNPDFIFLDIQMPEINGFQMIE
jgi:CheY-like chemotaxis protein